MPKLKNVTVDELRKVADIVMEAGQEASYIHQRGEQGYLDEVESPIQMATTFLAASASMADVGRLLIMKASLQEQKRELEERLRSKK